MGCSCWVTLDQCNTLFGIRVQVASEKAVWNAQKSGHSLKSHQEVDRVVRALLLSELDHYELSPNELN